MVKMNSVGKFWLCDTSMPRDFCHTHNAILRYDIVKKTTLNYKVFSLQKQKTKNLFGDDTRRTISSESFIPIKFLSYN